MYRVLCGFLLFSLALVKSLNPKPLLSQVFVAVAESEAKRRKAESWPQRTPRSFRGWGLGVQGLGFRVEVWGSRLLVSGSGSRAWGFRVRGVGFTGSRACGLRP